MRDVLAAETIADFCSGNPQWHVGDDRLVRSATAPTFPEAIAWVVAVAHTAEELDHHPDIDIRWRTVTFRLWTHSAGGVTELDLDLARRIDALVITQV